MTRIVVPLLLPQRYFSTAIYTAAGFLFDLLVGIPARFRSRAIDNREHFSKPPLGEIRKRVARLSPLYFFSIFAALRQMAQFVSPYCLSDSQRRAN